jgi:hypothetical protein
VTLLECVLVLAAGVFAGTINTVVGSGTLVTFPVLLAVGYGPVTANVSNTLGLVPGSVSGAIGYRAELAGQRRRAPGAGVRGQNGLTPSARERRSHVPSADEAQLHGRAAYEPELRTG